MKGVFIQNTLACTSEQIQKCHPDKDGKACTMIMMTEKGVESHCTVKTIDKHFAKQLRSVMPVWLRINRNIFVYNVQGNVAKLSAEHLKEQIVDRKRIRYSVDSVTVIYSNSRTGNTTLKLQLEKESDVHNI